MLRGRVCLEGSLGFASAGQNIRMCWVLYFEALNLGADCGSARFAETSARGAARVVGLDLREWFACSHSKPDSLAQS